MSIAKMRERGQLTIPYQYRKELGLEENGMVNIVKIGDLLILTRKQLAGDSASKKIESSMKKRGCRLMNC